MRKQTPVARFWRSYLVAEVILLFAVFKIPSLTSSGSMALAGIVAFVMLTLVPLVPTGRSRIQRRIGTVISGLLSGIFVVFLFQVSEDVKTTGGEGPNGEGSLMAALMGMAFFTALFVIPWAITLVRGIVVWNTPETDPGTTM